MYALFKGTYLVHAATDDSVIHWASFVVNTPTDTALFFDCRKFLVDGPLVFSHLRTNDEDVTCMACIASTVT